jgi:hypothetical protein
MGCTTPSDDRTMGYVRNMDARLRALERDLAGFKEITGACTTAGQSIVAVIATSQDPGTGVYTITFLSTPGRTYQVQTSTDGVNWTVAENVVEADADPAIMTEWLSDAYPLFEDTPRYFRVRVYPVMLIPCTPGVPACPDIIS